MHCFYIAIMQRRHSSSAPAQKKRGAAITEFKIEKIKTAAEKKIKFGSKRASHLTTAALRSAVVIDPPQNDRSIRLKMTAESGSK